MNFSRRQRDMIDRLARGEQPERVSGPMAAGQARTINALIRRGVVRWGMPERCGDDIPLVLVMAQRLDIR